MKQYADAFADEPPFEPDEIMTQHQEELHIENTPVDTTMTNRSAHKEEIALGTPKTSLLEFLIPSCRQKCNFQFR